MQRRCLAGGARYTKRRALIASLALPVISHIKLPRLILSLTGRNESLTREMPREPAVSPMARRWSALDSCAVSRADVPRQVPYRRREERINGCGRYWGPQCAAGLSTADQVSLQATHYVGMDTLWTLYLEVAVPLWD